MALTEEERRVSSRNACRRYRETHQEQVREAQHKWVEAHPDYKRKAREPGRCKQTLQKRQEFVQGILAGKTCAKCHKESNPRKLLFHHVDPSTKRFTVGSCRYSEAAILDEIAKCVIWCRSCHGKFHNTLHQKG